MTNWEVDDSSQSTDTPSPYGSASQDEAGKEGERRERGGREKGERRGSRVATGGVDSRELWRYVKVLPRLLIVETYPLLKEISRCLVHPSGLSCFWTLQDIIQYPSIDSNLQGRHYCYLQVSSSESCNALALMESMKGQQWVNKATTEKRGVT